jgi:uncharacterized membrane protein
MKKVRIISFLVFLVMIFSTLYLPFVALAQDEPTTDNITTDNVTTDNVTLPTEPVPVVEPEPTPVVEPEPTPADNVTLTTDYPTVEAVATGTFKYNVTVNYRGQEDRVFDLNTSVPSGWDVYIEPQYQSGTRVSSVALTSSYTGMSKVVTVTVSTPSFPPPDPGDYKILLTAVSGNVSGSLELVAKVTAKYSMSAVPLNQLYNTSALTGKDNIYSIQVSNLGSAPIENITFDSTHPDGWEIKFTPDKLDLLNTDAPKVIDVDIKPAAKSVSGDYMITLKVSGTEASATDMNVRVTVKTPTIWGWVGVIIIVIVVAGLFVVFMRFGRR